MYNNECITHTTRCKYASEVEKGSHSPRRRIGRDGLRPDDVVGVVVQRDVLLEPLDGAQRRALDAARQRDLLGIHEGAVVGRQTLDEERRG